MSLNLGHKQGFCIKANDDITIILLKACFCGVVFTLFTSVLYYTRHCEISVENRGNPFK